MEKDSLHDHDMFFTNESKIVYCQRCKNEIRAGSYWVLFCSCCNISDSNIRVERVMSCTYCEMPLDIVYNKENNYTHGVCNNPNCLDGCYSMQDLTLISLGRTIGEEPFYSPLKSIIDSLPEKQAPKPSEKVLPKLPQDCISIDPIVATTSWSVPISRGRKTPKRPNLDELDSMK